MTTEQILAEGRRRIAEAWEKERTEYQTSWKVFYAAKRTALESFCDWIESEAKKGAEHE
jgi:hypothetical protein